MTPGPGVPPCVIRTKCWGARVDAWVFALAFSSPSLIREPLQDGVRAQGVFINQDRPGRTCTGKQEQLYGYNYAKSAFSGIGHVPVHWDEIRLDCTGYSEKAQFDVIDPHIWNCPEINWKPVTPFHSLSTFRLKTLGTNFDIPLTSFHLTLSQSLDSLFCSILSGAPFCFRPSIPCWTLPLLSPTSGQAAGAGRVSALGVGVAAWSRRVGESYPLQSPGHCKKRG